MQRTLLYLGFFVINISLSLMSPLARSQLITSNVQVAGEAVVAADLHLTPKVDSGASITTHTNKKRAQKRGKEIYKVEGTEEDTIPDLTLIKGDKTSIPSDINIGDGFAVEGKQMQSSAALTPAKHGVGLSASSPIYVTIPIYINTVAGVPITLSIGSQKVPVAVPVPVPAVARPESRKEDSSLDPAPTSQYNKLL